MNQLPTDRPQLAAVDEFLLGLAAQRTTASIYLDPELAGREPCHS
jgi:hypothetical protein